MCRRVLPLLACLLALATAVALLAAAAALGDARGGPPPSGAPTEAAVRRFYAAANAAILTGDGAALDAAVAPNLVDHAPPPGVPPGWAGLARYLTAVHTTAPGAELVVEDLAAVGDRALVRVTVRGVDGGAFLGLPLAAGRPLWGAVDVWRVAGGRVAERWGDGDRLALLEPLGQVAFDAGGPDRQVVALERLEIAPGGVLAAWRPAEARLVYLEAGALTVAVTPDSPALALLASEAGAGAGRPTEVGPDSSISLAAGDLLALPPRTAHALRNDTAVPAAALAMMVSRAGTPIHATVGCGSANHDQSSCASDAGSASAVAARPLAGGRTTALPPGPLAAAVGRATLAPGADLPTNMTAGLALLHVEAGTLGVETEHGAAWVRRGGTGASREVAAGTLGAGDGAQLQPGTAVALRNAGEEPAVVLLLTIAPAVGVPAP